MNLIIYDFEVFKYDTLLGALIINGDNVNVLQTWNLDEIKQFYLDNVDSIWIGHNITRYDNLILQAIVNDDIPYRVSKRIISSDKKQRLNIKLNYFDLIDFHFGSLKAIECAAGKKISESEVDFDINRELTDEEKEMVESYNLDDLDQTLDNLIYCQSELAVRLELVREFGLDLDVLHITETQIAERVLKAERIDGIENWYLPPKIYSQMQIKNKEALNFYLSEGFRKNEKLSINVCELQNDLGSGGIHGAIKKCYFDEAYYLDVSGYYNLIMINYDLLPRTIPEESKKIYKELYHYQLTLKKIDPIKRAAIKVVLLAVFGSMTNEYTKFYDPNKGTLVTIVGQMFLIDLLEKLEGKVTLIQSNTDGIIIKPLPGVSLEEVKAITDEWQQRTGFVLKFDKIYNLYQRDVNNYFFVNEDGSVHSKGEIAAYYNAWQNPLEKDAFRAKEAMIIYHSIIDFFLYKKFPEQTVEENKANLRMFQFVCKQNTYDWTEFVQEDLSSGKITTEKIQKVNRAFASNSTLSVGKLIKKKNDGRQSKLQNVPNNLFVWNEEILSDETSKKLQTKINYQYYIDRAYERISEFIQIPEIKDINYE